MSRFKKEFGKELIQIITKYIFWFFVGNLYFLLLNIPLLCILIVLFSNGARPISNLFASITIICCVPIGPAMTALLSVMGKLIREKDINITKNFFKAYKVNFFQSLFFWAIEIIIISLLFIDIRFFISNKYPQFFTAFIFIIMTFIFLMSMYVFPIISRFYLSTKTLLRTAAFYTIMKFHITILNLLSFFAVGAVLFKFPTVILEFASSIICYLMMFYQQNILSEIQENLKQSTKKVQE